MIVIVTNREDYTADYLILELQRRQIDYVRFNVEDFPQHARIAWSLRGGKLDGYFEFPKRRVDFSEIKSIWYRRPVPPVPSSGITDSTNFEFAATESQAALDGLWRSLDCFWVSHPDNLRRAEIKLYQLKVATGLGFEIPATIVTNDPTEARSFYQDQVGSVIYKPLQRSRLIRGDDVSLIYSNPVGPQDFESLDRVLYAPVLLQKYVPKDVEIRATVIGGQVLTVEIHSQDIPESRHDWRRGDTASLRHQAHQLPKDTEAKCVTLVDTLGLAFGAIDLIKTPDGEYVFLEINPNGQWAWIQQLCPEIPLRETLVDLLVRGRG